MEHNKKVMEQTAKETQPYKLYSIKEGVVIDHVPARKALEVISILGIEQDRNSIISIGINFTSKKAGRKDVIKIENKELSKEELNKITLIAPHATVNIIKNYEVAEKVKIVIPSQFEQIIRCPNPKCITAHEKTTSRFITVNKDPLKVKCYFCERTFDKENVKML